MRNVKVSVLQCAKHLMPLWVIAACCGLVLPGQAQPIPSNDNLTNAQPILGVTGTVTGTNANATAEAGEPPPFGGSPAGATIWYVWTAPFGDTMDFNTRGSTDPFGNPLPTSLAVYVSTVATNAPTYAMLTKVAANQIDPNANFAPASRVDFTPIAGHQYYIQVDGAGGTANEGTIVLNWGPSVVAGNFGFSTPNFFCETFDDYYTPPIQTYTDYPEMHPDLRNATPDKNGAQGDANVRITVTRQNGSVGRCEVTLMVTNTYYGSIALTNLVITNIFTTNYDLTGDVLSYTNTFFTNAPAEIIYEEIGGGGIFGGFGFFGTVLVTNYYDTTSGQTNASGVLGPVGTTDIPLGTYNVTNYFTNFPCAASLGVPSYVTNGNLVTGSVTNIYCESLTGVNETASAVPGVDYTPFTTNLTFDDFQMSQDIYIQVAPGVDLLEGFGGSGGPIFFSPPLTSLLNASVSLVLTNAVLDPLENQDIVPPTITEPTATLTIDNFYGSPFPGFPDGTNVAFGSYSVINWGRATYRVDKNATNAYFYVYCWPPPAAASYTVSYTIDSKNPGLTVLDYNLFPTVAGSDYAVPFNIATNNTDTNDWDFALPTNLVDKSAQWIGINGTINFSPTDPIPGEHLIAVPINNNGFVEFDQDFYLQLYLTAPQAMGDYQAIPPAFIGNTPTANVTINFDRVNNGVQPGGAVDRDYNVDAVDLSQPPFNAEPGANGPVLAVGIQANGEAVIGGQFTAFNATPNNQGNEASYIATIQTNGQLDATFNPGSGPDNFVSALAIDPLGRIIIGGGFTSVNGVLASHVARLLPGGTLDTSFQTGFGANGTVRSLVLDASGNILIGGDFTSYNTTNCNHIARLLPDGSLDTSFNAGSGTDQDVLAIGTDSTGRILIGGPFRYVNGTNYNGVARLFSNGTLDTNFNIGSGADGTVNALVVQANNEVWVAGNFPHFNLNPIGGIALLTPAGALDTSFKPGTGANDVIYSMALQPDGKVLLGGQFTSINGTRRVGVARLLPQGWVDTSFMDTAYNQFAGLINHYYNTNTYNANDFPASYNTRNAAYAIALEPASSNVIIGGSFMQIGGGFTRDDRHIRWNLARLIGTPTTGLKLNGGAAPGLANDPGNITLNPNGYSANDTAGSVFITVVRTNGSLGRVSMVLATNTFPPGPGSAGSADFSLRNTGAASYNVVWDDWDVADNAFGWRSSDGFYGPNNNTLPLSDSGASFLYLNIKNNRQAMEDLLASLTLLQVAGTNNFTLGGEPIPMQPAIGVPTSQLKIIDDNVAAGTLGFSMTNYGVVESGGFVTISVLRTNGGSGPVSVAFSTRNGFTNGPTGSQPAVSGGLSPDYVLTNGVLSFGAGVLSNGFQVQILDHSTEQSNKFFNVLLSGPTGGATLDTNSPPLVTSNTVVSIIDDHFQPGHLSFNSSSYSVTKGGTATITVVRTGGALGELSAQVVASAGTASNGVNYVWTTNVTLVWQNADITNKTFTLQTLEDKIVEGAKTVTLTLSNAMIGGTSPQAQTNALILSVPPTTATLTIADDDSPGTLSFAAPLLNGAPNFNVLQNAGQVLVTVVRTNGTVGTLSAHYGTFDGTNAVLPVLSALAGTNYGETNGTLIFGDGVTSQTFSVPIYNYTNTANTLFNLVLSNPNPSSTNYPKFGTVTILNTNLVLSPAGGVDTTLGTGVGFNDVVQSLSLQPDGALLAGGNFSAVNNYPYNELARLNADGSVDTAFLFNQAGADGMVRVVLSQTPNAGQTNGFIMVGGDFTHMDTTPRNGIARLNLDGSLDGTFNPGSGADSSVFAIVETFLPGAVSNQAPSRYYYVGGAFANYNGTASSGIVRLTETGQIDPNFNAGQGVTGTNGTVHAVAVQPNGQVILGGDFTSFDNGVYHHLVRLNADGTVDATFNPDTGADVNGSVRALAIQPDGRILIGGLFTNVNGVILNHVARLNADGSVDSGFNAGPGCNGLVLSIALDSQARILLGGEFTLATGVTRNGLTRINPDGTIDPTINFGSGASGFVQSIAIQGNDEINIGGGFNSFNGVPAGNYARLYGGAISGPGTIEFSQNFFGVMENGTNALITIERTGGTADTSVSVIFSTSDGSGLNGVDYTGVTNTVTFPLGETFQTVVVPVLNNFAVSSNKTVNLSLSNPTGVGGGAPGFGPELTAVLVITNSNSGVSFSAPSYRQSENVAAGSAIIPIVRGGNPNSTVTVTVATTTNGSAIELVNYVPQTNTFIFAPGVLTNLFLVPLINAADQFSDLTVDLQLTNAIGALLVSPDSATLTIASVNAGPGVLAFSQTNYLVSEGAVNADITIVRTNGLSGPVSVTLSTSNLTAQAGINYLAYSNTISFADGQSSQDVLIPIIQLTNAAQNSTVLLTLSNPTGGATIGITNQAVLTIENDIENFSFDSAAYFVNEGGGSVVIGILRNGPTNSTVTVGYTTYSPTNAYSTNGLAEPNVDYVPTFGTLTFTPGETLQTIPVHVLQGTTVNGPSTFQVLLQNPTGGAQIGVPGSTIVTIIGDITGFAFVTNSYVVAENGSNVVVTVNRFNVNTGTVSVGFDTSDGTALAGRDYLSTNGTLTFVDGQGTASFTVPILNPNLVESNLTFNLALFSPSTNAYLVYPSNAVVTITNVLTGISFSSPTYTVSECGVQALIPVIRTGVSNLSSSITFSTLAGGTAVAGQNYFITNLTLNFATNQTETNVVIQVIDDHIIEPNHTVNMSLGNVQGALLLNPSAAVLTIDECDGSFIVSSGTALVSESTKPANGIIDPGETVTVLFGLRCISGGGTTNLVATLLPGDGIANPMGAGGGSQQDYGVLLEGGHTVSKPFTFTANATNGQNITATFDLQDGSRNLGTVAFGFTVGSITVSFTNSAFITINDSTNPPTEATPYPSIMNVGGLSGNIEHVTVTLSNLSHTFPSDIDAVLVSPGGFDSLLMGQVGGSTAARNVTLTFDQLATASLPGTSQLVSGTFLPTAFGFIPQFPPATNSLVAAPLLPYPTNLNVFAGTPANGAWALFVVDDKPLDSGMISNGWVLSLGTGNPVPQNADLTATLASSPSVPTIGNPLVFTIGLTNYGPAGATNIVISDALPAGLVYVTNDCNCASGTNGTISFNVPALLAGSGVLFTVTVVPNAVGLYTNTVTATANQPDPNSNNVVSVVVLVSPATADVGVNLSDTPNPVALGNDLSYTISVTNGGPSAAVNVITTDVLPAGLSPLSISASAGTFTNSNGSIIWTLPSLGAPPGANSAAMTVLGQVILGGTLVDSVTVSSDIYDPYKLNNFASVKTEVNVPALTLVSGPSGYSLTWPSTAGPFVLAGATSLTPPVTWTVLTTPPPTLQGGQYVYPLPVGGYHFFRLQTQFP